MNKRSYLGKLFTLIFLFTLTYSEESQNRKGKTVNGRNNIPSESDGRISRSQSVKIEQKRRFKQNDNQIRPSTQFNQMLFTIVGVQEFLINLPVSQQVAIQLFTYIMVDNAYMTIRNIESQAPIKVYVYQNNNKIIHQSDFYFQNVIVFDGQEHSTYTIRFMNSGSQKLVAMNLKKLTELTHIQKMVDKQSAVEFSQKTNRLNQQFKFLFNSFERYGMINFQAVKSVLGSINLYFYWQVAETILATVVCLIQLTFIKKICKTQSIV